MAIRGMNLFREWFADYKDAFILIGGAACDLWFADHNLAFRATRDLDMVLVLDRINADFVSRFHKFIEEGEYNKKQLNENGPPVLYRFAKPGKDKFPYMLELFCRKIPELSLVSSQHIIPIRMEDVRSLSAILLHESYYNFLLDHCRETYGIMAADAAALIPLKARAWLDLTVRKAAGEPVKEDDIKKHRNDIFRLAITLPGKPVHSLPDEVALDIDSFLREFPPDNGEWNAIQQAIRPTVGGTIAPDRLIRAIRDYYQLGRE